MCHNNVSAIERTPKALMVQSTQCAYAPAGPLPPQPPHPTQALSTDGSSSEAPLQNTHSSPQTASSLTGPLWPQLHPADLIVLTDSAAALSSSSTITWYPEYGCALLALGRPQSHSPAAAGYTAASSACSPASTGPAGGRALGCARGAGGVGGGVARAQAAMQRTGCRVAPQHVSLHLVALDGWAFRTHGSSARWVGAGQLCELVRGVGVRVRTCLLSGLVPA